jgi:hypothetical protein
MSAAHRQSSGSRGSEGAALHVSGIQRANALQREASSEAGRRQHLGNRILDALSSIKAAHTHVE